MTRQYLFLFLLLTPIAHSATYNIPRVTAVYVSHAVNPPSTYWRYASITVPTNDTLYDSPVGLNSSVRINFPDTTPELDPTFSLCTTKGDPTDITLGGLLERASLCKETFRMLIGLWGAPDCAQWQYSLDSGEWRPLPGQILVCGRAPPTPACQIKNQIMIDHGVLTPTMANRHRASQDLIISCVTPATATIRLTTSPNGEIPLPLGGHTTLSTSSAPLGTPVKLIAGDTHLELTSTLSGVTTPGISSASGVLVLDLN